MAEENVSVDKTVDSVAMEVGDADGNAIPIASRTGVDKEIISNISGYIGTAKTVDWDNTVVDSAQPKAYESFIIPIADTPDHKHPTQRVANTYAAKKTVAQGMMDIALITANANQLRYIIEFNSQSRTYYLSIVLITISLILQVAVGISLIFKGRFDLRGQAKGIHARRINNYVVVAVFLVTIINVFIASFTITGSGTQPLTASVGATNGQ